MKVIKKFLIPTIIVLPTIPVVSCSSNNSIESRLDELLKRNDLCNVSLDPSVKNFNDLFSSKIENPILITPNKPIIDFESSLSKEDLELFKLTLKLNSIIIPELSTLKDNKINDLKVNVEILGGHLESPVVKTINLDLTKIPEFDTSIQNNNLMDENIIDSEKNSLWRVMSTNLATAISSYIIKNGITQTKLEKEPTILNINLENNQFHFVNQKNFYLFWDPNENINNLETSIYVYTNNKAIDDLNSIKKDCFYFKINNIKLASGSQGGRLWK